MLFGSNDPEAAAVRIADTLSFRQANGLVADDAELWRAVEEHPARDRWPFAYLPGSEVPDGSPVCYARLSQLQVAATLAAFDEEELMHFVALWFEGAQRLLGDSSRRRGDPVRGTYDVYDCADLSAWSFLSEVTLPRHFSRHLVDPTDSEVAPLVPPAGDSRASDRVSSPLPVPHPQPQQNGTSAKLHIILSLATFSPEPAPLVWQWCTR